MSGRGVRFSEEWLADRLKQNAAGAGVERAAPSTGRTAPAPVASKYRNEPVAVDNIRFASLLEADRYVELKFERRLGVVRLVLLQIPFRLPGRVCYRADFLVWYHDGRLEFEDTKGADTQDSKNKRKQVAELYGVDIKVLRRDQVSRQVLP